MCKVRRQNAHKKHIKKPKERRKNKNARYFPFFFGILPRIMTIRINDKKAPDAVVALIAQTDQLPAQLTDIATRAGIDAATLQNDFKAESKEITILYAGDGSPRRMYLLGLGKKSGFPEVLAAMRTFGHRYKAKLPARLGIDLRLLPSTQVIRAADAAVTGLLLGQYDIGLYRKPADEKPVFGTAKSALEILVPSAQMAEAEQAARRGAVFAEATKQIFDWVNAAGNRKTPQMIAEWVLKAGQEFGFKATVMDTATIQKEGLELLWTVGKGSPHPPLMLWLEYGTKTRKTKTPCLGLVGKGVTFDTGGISIKPSANMQYMKSDMGGAAAVLGAFMVAARLDLPIRLVGAVPLAENMVDGLAVKPGDVVGSFAGKTVEITDTDAEGRLILADGLAYLIKKETPDALLDLATLTGSIIRAIGTQAAGLFSKNDALVNNLAQAGEGCGERLWRMPLWDEYGTDLKSDVADLRNFTGKPMAESISAAKFLEHFTAEHPAWAHLDIAGMAFGDSEFAQTKSATGYGIRLLVEFMERYLANEGKL